MRVTAFTFAVLSICTPLFAQERVGTSMVEGRVVDLFSDRTWSFRESTSERCTIIGKGIEFCDQTGSWKPAAATGDAAAMFRYDDAHYGQFVVEQLGREQGVNMPIYQEVVVQNAADFVGVTPSDIPVLQIEDGEVSGFASSEMVLAAKMDGMSIMFANTIVIRDSDSIQIVTFAIAEDFTQKHQSLHREFVDSVSLR